MGRGACKVQSIGSSGKVKCTADIKLKYSESRNSCTISNCDSKRTAPILTRVICHLNVRLTSDMTWTNTMIRIVASKTAKYFFSFELRLLSRSEARHRGIVLGMH